MDRYHVHIQMDIVDEDPDSADIHTIQRRVWCLTGFTDLTETFARACEISTEITELQAGLIDRTAGAHRG